VEEEFLRRLAAFAHASGLAMGEVLKRAFDEYEARHNESPRPGQGDGNGPSLLDRWIRLGYVGCLQDLSVPADLSSGLRHREGFGRD
jgi:hypothetical protein